MSTPEVDMSDYEALGCLHELFTKQACKTPQNVAVVDCAGTQITYEELNQMTDLLACKLQRLGLDRNIVGGILMERSLEYTVSYISILKAGGAYLPIEVSWPRPILESVLEDASPSIICTKEAFSSKVESSNVPLVYLDGNWLQKLKIELKGYSPYLPIKSTLDDLAYVVYSSGTTGKPKGIQCPHRGAVFSYTWRHRAYPYGPDEREACNVFFVWEMLRPLAKGLPMYIIPDDVIYDPPQLADFIYKNKITRMLFTPTLLQALLENKGIDLDLKLKSLRIIIFCGEVVTTALRNLVANLMPWIQQLNLYSISECHDVSNADLSDMPSDSTRDFCPTGKLMPGVKAVIMDENLIIKSVGEPGEIYIGGPGLAIGYLNRPELNALRFIARPAHVSALVGERLYRTGDLGYVLSDGSLEVCGRCDSMVKIRGYSIELEVTFRLATANARHVARICQGCHVLHIKDNKSQFAKCWMSMAVKTNLLEVPGVVNACIQAFGPEGGDKTLVAFVVLQENVTMSNRTLRSHLKKKLSFYMIPSRFIILNRIPVVEATGKLDTKQLISMYADVNKENSKLEVVKIVGGKEKPVLPMELKIAEIWSDLLGINFLDMEDSFFDLGGHSLLAASLSSRLNNIFGSNVTTAAIFRHPTIPTQVLLVSSCSNTESAKKIKFEEELEKFKIEFNGIDSRMRSFWQTVYINPNKFNTGTVLLTGATGYVGCFLLQQLLLYTQTTVYCLVRESPTQFPLERLVAARQRYGLRQFISTDRVIPVKGDVSLTNLGFSRDLYNALSLEVDVVIHAAAQVNLIFPFSALYNANVLGTYNVLLFALNSKIKPIHYISTSSVFPEKPEAELASETADLSQLYGQLNDGYGQTKCLAEGLIQEATRRGFPTAVYRCGNVGGSPLVDGWNPSDFNLHMLKGVFETGCAPDINWQIELTPVDFVSQVVINLVCNLQESVGKTFHLINNSTFLCGDLWTILKNLGYSITSAPFNEWKEFILKHKDSKLTPLSQLLENLVVNEVFFSSNTTFKQDNVLSVLTKLNMTYPQLTPQLFSQYIDSLARVGIFPKPKQDKVDGSLRLAGFMALKDRVVVVTGASSGIGENIARTLALAGATVVLAARRIDRLNAITQELNAAGAKAIPLQMDVCNVQEVSVRMKEVETNIGPIHVLVNNAGVMFYQFIKKCDLPTWQQMVEVNINGTLNCLAAVLGRMVSRGSGHIVNISSDGARKPFPGLTVYCGTKYFVRCLSGGLRSELASSGIKVTDIQPGDVTSELHNNVTDPEAELTFDCSTRAAVLKPSDVGQAVLYALSQPPNCAINEILLEPQSLPL